MKYIITLSDVGRDIADIIKEQKKPPKFDARLMVRPMNIDSFAWMEWCDYRIGKKKPISAKAAKMQLSMLGKYTPIDQVRVVNNSIQNDYQGLFDLKVINQPPQHERLNNVDWAIGIETQE